MAQEKAKSNSVLTSAWDLLAGVVTVTVLGLKDGIVKFNAREVAGAQAYDNLTDWGKRALLHGTTQRLSDRAAIGRDKITGQSASPAEKFAAIRRLAEHYATGGSWELQGGEVPPVNRPALYAAVAAVRGVEAEAVERVYRDKPDEVVRTLLTIPDIAGEYVKRNRPAVQNDKAKELLEELEKAAAQ